MLLWNLKSPDQLESRSLIRQGNDLDNGTEPVTSSVRFRSLDPLFVRAMTWTWGDAGKRLAIPGSYWSRSLIRQGNDLDWRE